MSATATIIAVNNAERHRQQLAAEEAHRACGGVSTSHVSTVAAPDLATLQRKVVELQARIDASIQAQEVRVVREPFITLDDYLFGVKVCSILFLVVLVGVAISFAIENRNHRRGYHGT